jgi:hypothetical protein
MAQIQVSDPDNVSELLCNGPFHISFQGVGEHQIGILTFTAIRPDPGPLFQENTIVDRAFVQARIAMNIPSLVALRDLLINNVRTETEISPTGGVGSAVRH